MFVVLPTVETRASRTAQPVVCITLRPDAIKLEELTCTTASASVTQEFPEVRACPSSPLFLSLSHIEGTIETQRVEARLSVEIRTPNGMTDAWLGGPLPRRVSMSHAKGPPNAQSCRTGRRALATRPPGALARHLLSSDCEKTPKPQQPARRTPGATAARQTI